MRRPRWMPPLTLRTLGRALASWPGQLLLSRVAPKQAGVIGDLAAALDGVTAPDLPPPVPLPPASLPSVSSFKLTPADPLWLTIAAREIGQREVSGAGDNPRIVEYFTATNYGVSHDAVPWCSAFVCWVMREAGYQSTKSAAAVSWLKYGQPIDTTQERGAICVIRRRDAAPDPNTGSQTGNHVGFLVDASPTHVTLLGGNQHDSVCVSTFPRATYLVRAARWPASYHKLPSAPAQAA